MGILGLRKVIEQCAPGAIKKIAREDLAGWKIAIDASIGVYELFYIGTKHKIIGSTGLPINHIQGTFYRAVKYLAAGIIPVYIFDGKPPEIKAGVIAQRAEMKINGHGVAVPQSAFTDVMRLLQLMKIPYVQAPSEAEAQAARMCADGIVDAVATTDTDALTFGAPCQIIGLDGDAKFVTAITREHVLAELGLSGAQFIDLCILLGSDYTTAGLPGVGPKRSLKLLRERGNIEGVIKALGVAPLPGFTFAEARAEFERPGVMRVDAPARPTYTMEEIAAIDKFLLDSGLAPARYAKALGELKKTVR